MSKKVKKVLFCLDGPDGSGKTKLCQHLIEKYRFNYLHQGVHEDIMEYHDSRLTFAVNDIEFTNENFIFDRLHVSEYIYGNEFRDGPKYDIFKLNDNIIEACKERNIKYKIILCIPNKEVVLAKHAERSANGDEMFDTVDTIYDKYLEFYEEYKDKLDIYKYDYIEDSDYINIDNMLENL